MVAGRTFLRRLGTLRHISAYRALPLDRLVAFPHLAAVYQLAQSIETILVHIFDRRYGLENVLPPRESPLRAP